MFEKVNPCHPDKIADRIAGALVDYAYRQQENPRIAVEVLIGHGRCYIMTESSVEIPQEVADGIVTRIAGTGLLVVLTVVPQDAHLANNQAGEIRCGDNGIFKGVPTNFEQGTLTHIARMLYDRFKADGKYIFESGEQLIVCQSNADKELLHSILPATAVYPSVIINPLGDWTGGLDVDTGATNRKLGSDMGDAVTGGGLHGKDLSKADVSLNIYAHLEAQRIGRPVELYCAIGDTEINGKPYSQIVEKARSYIRARGGFEKFAEWGLI